MTAYVFEFRAPGFRLLDQAVLEQPRELGVDLAVARRPGVGERLLEVLEQLVAGTRLVGESPEECVLQRRRGKLYLLVGRATFSAAANFASEIDRDTRAVILGEPTGGGVETYADTFPVLLPTLGWYVNIAARYHERKKGKNDRRLAVAPDIRIDLSSAQYFAGQDPVLERALRGL